VVKIGFSQTPKQERQTITNLNILPGDTGSVSFQNESEVINIQPRGDTSKSKIKQGSL
jgi:hypothetical protein